MKPLSLSLIAVVVGGTVVGDDVVVREVLSDSRKPSKDGLFVALKGSRVDGHTFVPQALERGAVAAMVTRGGNYPCPYIIVDCCVSALALLAKHHLANHPAKIIGITGSMGKTTTKEMLAACISAQMRVFKNPGNFNTEVGLPLSVLQHNQEEVLILEMGMRGLGQIAELTEIAPPDIAVVTNIGESHLEVLGSRGAIAAAKGEIVIGMRTGGVAIINRDDDYYKYLSNLSQGPVVSFGYHPEADFRIEKVRHAHGGRYAFTLHTGTESFAVDVPLPGRHNVLNAAAALAASSVLGGDMAVSIMGLSQSEIRDRRLDVVSLPTGETIIDDTYNASPASTIAALETLRDMPAVGRRIAVLGDMLELGARAKAGHAEVGVAAHEVCDLVFTVGELAGIIADVAECRGTKVIRCASKTEVIEGLLAHMGSGDTVLIKGSRGMQLEDVVKALQERKSC